MNGSSPRCFRAILPLIATLAVCASARAGVGVGKEFGLPNSDFDAGLTSWSVWTSDGQAHLAPSTGPSGGRNSVRCDLPAGVQAALALTLPVAGRFEGAQPSRMHVREGEKVEFGAWVFLGTNSAAGAVYLEVLASDGLAQSTIAASLHLDPSSDPRGAWHYVHTVPSGASDARVPAGSTALTVVLRVEAPGTVWLDDVQGGLFEYAEFSVRAASFEDPAEFAMSWSTQGSVSLNDPVLERDAYYGARYLKLGGAAYAMAAQPIEIADGHGSPAPDQVTEGCAWFYLDPDVTGLGAQANPALWIKLTLFAWAPGTPMSSATLLAGVQWNPTLAEMGTWTFLETELSATAQVPRDRSQLWVVIEKSILGTVRADFVQAGERFAVNGNPRRHVGCNYVGWYRSPLFPGATTNPSTPAAIWRNWAWLTPPPCNPAYAGPFHNPDCATSTTCIRVNLRRDGAASVESTLDDLPLAGAYDSRDPDLLRYHVRLAQAIGIDSFVYDHQGHKLAQQNAAAGIEPINEQAFEALLDAAEEPGSSLKIAAMYEPKVHFNGWIQGEPTLAEKKLGIVADLTHLCRNYFRRKAMLKHDGRLVVYVFRNGICNASGTQCMQDSDWQEVADAVELASGRRLCLIADALPSAQSPFQGMSRWKLASLEMLKYRTFTDFENHVPSWPEPGAEALEALARESNSKSATWASADDRSRFAVAIAWPGFDDSGVAGWAGTNLIGTDGQALCVRVGAEFGGAFYSTTWGAALAEDFDWVQIATWNDWNEGTQIEPRWNAIYAKHAQNGGVPSPSVLDLTFRRAFETQAAIALFKGLAPGIGPGPAGIEACAAQYLRTAGTAYD